MATTLAALQTMRDDIITELNRLTKSATTEAGGIRSSAEQKTAQLERELAIVNRQIQRLTGARTINISGIDA